jgi:prevent-host-death family protein
MVEVGVKVLKDRLSEYLQRAQGGERLVITDRGRPIAMLTPIEESPEVKQAWELVAKGLASWSGGKPRGAEEPPRLAGGKSAAEIVLEDRR